MYRSSLTPLAFLAFLWAGLPLQAEHYRDADRCIHANTHAPDSVPVIKEFQSSLLAELTASPSWTRCRQKEDQNPLLQSITAPELRTPTMAARTEQRTPSEPPKLRIQPNPAQTKALLLLPAPPDERPWTLYVLALDGTPIHVDAIPAEQKQYLLEGLDRWPAGYYTVFIQHPGKARQIELLIVTH